MIAINQMHYKSVALMVQFAMLHNDLSKTTIPDKNVETKCNFCNFLLILAPVISNPPFPPEAKLDL